MLSYLTNNLFKPDFFSTLDKVLILFVIAGAWFFFRPFAGCTHDAYIYGFQATAAVVPQLKSTDIFFKYFDQGQFSLVTIFYGWLVGKLGLHDAMLLFFRVSQILWFCAATRFCFVVMPTARLGFLSLAAISFSTGIYHEEIQVIGETFFTARLIAEVFTLLSLSFLFSQSYIWALIFGFIATTLHPLGGIWSLLLVVGVQLYNFSGSRNYFYLWVVSIAVASFTLVFLFSAVEYPLQLFDTSRSPFLYITEWSYQSWLRILQQLILLLVVISAVNESHTKNILWVVLSVTLAAIWFCALGDEFNIKFIIQLQLWRVLQVSYILGLVLSFSIIYRYKKSPLLFPVTLLVIATWLFRDHSGALFGAILLLLIYLEGRIPGLAVLFSTEKVIKLLSLCAILLFIDICLNYFFWIDFLFTVSPGAIVFKEKYSALMFLSLCLMILANYRFKHLVMGFSGILLFTSYFAYSVPFVPEQGNAAKVLAEKIDVNEVVFWPNHMHEVWHNAKRSFYFSTSQLSPSIFSEELLVEGVRRMELLQRANALAHYEVYRMKNDSRFGGTQHPRSIANYDWQLMCSDRELDWVVLDESQFDEAPGHIFNHQQRRFMLVNCSASNTRQALVL
jgi:hypothetical protein